MQQALLNQKLTLFKTTTIRVLSLHQSMIHYTTKGNQITDIIIQQRINYIISIYLFQYHHQHNNHVFRCIHVITDFFLYIFVIILLQLQLQLLLKKTVHNFIYSFVWFIRFDSIHSYQQYISAAASDGKGGGKGDYSLTDDICANDDTVV